MDAEQALRVVDCLADGGYDEVLRSYGDCSFAGCFQALAMQHRELRLLHESLSADVNQLLSRGTIVVRTAE